ncbi:MAG: Rhomboid family protein [Jatrophihabitantaceae bacterium]|nr:Rhomboid family protein [Jatrophihabitantaceae bacterium]
MSLPRSTPGESAGDRADAPWWSAMVRRPDTWTGALVLMLALVGALWAIEAVDLATDHRLLAYGIRPRRLDGLDGVVFSPFLHAGVGHLVGNSVPFVLLGWIVLVSGVRQWAIATAIIVLLGGLGTWLIAPSGLVVGASGVVMGWLGYLLGRAYFARSLIAIAAAIVTVLFFGTLLWGLLPTVRHGVSWQGHLCGFAAGVAAAWFLHARGNAAKGRSSAVGAP